MEFASSLSLRGKMSVCKKDGVFPAPSKPPPMQNHMDNHQNLTFKSI